MQMRMRMREKLNIQKQEYICLSHSNFACSLTYNKLINEKAKGVKGQG